MSMRWISTKRTICFIGNSAFLMFLGLVIKLIILSRGIGKVFTNPDGFIYFVEVYNDGAAFNLLAGYNWFLVITAAIVLACCVWYVFKSRFYISDKFLLLMSFFCAGILGNAYERIEYGHVTDYIKLNLFGMNLPVFNVYDIFITCGAFFIALTVLIQKHNEYCENRDVDEDDLYRDI